MYFPHPDVSSEYISEIPVAICDTHVNNVAEADL
jgi:hypothetical protein